MGSSVALSWLLSNAAGIWTDEHYLGVVSLPHGHHGVVWFVPRLGLAASWSTISGFPLSTRASHGMGVGMERRGTLSWNPIPFHGWTGAGKGRVGGIVIL